MSYYAADYYRNPTPYTSSDIGAPVPGWGTSIQIAGPARVGVGQAFNIGFRPKGWDVEEMRRKLKEEQEKPLPWWVWPLGGAALVITIGVIGAKKGWL